jgi:hypothetical protein
MKSRRTGVLTEAGTAMKCTQLESLRIRGARLQISRFCDAVKNNRYCTVEVNKIVAYMRIIKKSENKI